MDLVILKFCPECVLNITTQPKNKSVCEGDSATFSITATGDAPIKYQWLFNGNIIPGATGSSYTSNPVSGADTGSYSCIVKNSCDTITSNASKLTINSIPVANAGIDDTICSGYNTILTASGGTTYKWSTTETTINITVNPTSTATYTVTVANGVCTNTDEVIVFVNTLPTADAGTDDTICYGDSTSLTANGGTVYEWNTTATTNSITVIPATNTTYTVTVTDINNCTATDEALIVVHPLPPSPVVPDVTICLNETHSATLSVTNPGGNIYEWYDSLTGGTLLHTGSAYTVNSITKLVTYYVQTISPEGCTAPVRVPVTIIIGIEPTANFIGEPTSLEQNQTVQFTDLSLNAAAWHWTFGLNEGESSEQHPKYTYRNIGIYTVELIVTSTDGCKDTLLRKDYIEVKKKQEIFIPNAFTPNKDGKNDVLYVRGPVATMYIEIYNQWGLKIFESNEQSTGWDGTWKGKEQPEGNYVYVFKGTTKDGQEVKIAGMVTLLR